MTSNGLYIIDEEPKFEILEERITALVKGSKIGKYFRETMKQIKKIIIERADLERQGIHPGGYYMKDNKYLVKTYPIVDGKQRREYIGSDRYKQEEVGIQIKRYAEWIEARKELNRWHSKLTRVARELEYVADNLDRTKQRVFEW